MQIPPCRTNLHAPMAEFAWRSSRILHGMLGMFYINFQKVTSSVIPQKYLRLRFLWITFLRDFYTVAHICFYGQRPSRKSQPCREKGLALQEVWGRSRTVARATRRSCSTLYGPNFIICIGILSYMG